MSGKDSHFYVGECGELIFYKRNCGKIFEKWENGGSGTMKNGYFVQFCPIVPVFLPFFLPFSSPTSRHNPPQPTSPVLWPLFRIAPPPPHFPPLFQTPKLFAELVGSVAMNADAGVIASRSPNRISQVNVVQRRGRAGRVREGVAVHLFPKDFYKQMREFPIPEVLRTPLEELCLSVKALDVGDAQTFLRKAMDPPEPHAIRNALVFLQMIRALDADAAQTITPLGRLFAALPVHPTLGRCLLFGAVLGYARPLRSSPTGRSVLVRDGGVG